MNRRHDDMQAPGNQKLTSEIEKELERIKERLRITESDLMFERNSRLNSNSTQQIAPANNIETTNALLKQMEEMKNAELKRQKDELRSNRENSKKIVHELNEKIQKFETTIKDLQERLGKQSHVGWMKDDIELEKDTVLKQIQEIEKLQHTV